MVVLSLLFLFAYLFCSDFILWGYLTYLVDKLLPTVSEAALQATKNVPHHLLFALKLNSARFLISAGFINSAGFIYYFQVLAYSVACSCVSAFSVGIIEAAEAEEAMNKLRTLVEKNLQVMIQFGLFFSSLCLFLIQYLILLHPDCHLKKIALTYSDH